MLLFDTYVNQSVVVMVPEEKCGSYLLFALAARYEELRAWSDSTSTRGSLSGKILRRFALPCLTKKQLERFESLANPLIRVIESNLRESKSLAELRDALLPKLMSGEIDVSKVDLTQLNSHLVNQAIRRFVARCEVGYGAIRKSSLINLAVALRVFQKKGRYRLANAFDIPSEINCKMKFSIVFRCFFPNLDRTRANQQLIIRCENMKSNVVVFR